MILYLATEQNETNIYIYTKVSFYFETLTYNKMSLNMDLRIYFCDLYLSSSLPFYQISIFMKP